MSSEVRRSRRRAGTEHNLAVGVIMWHLDDQSDPIRSQNLIVLINDKIDFSLYNVGDIV